MKKIIVIGVFVLIAIGLWQSEGSFGGAGGTEFRFNSANQATTTVGTLSGTPNWTQVLAADSSRGYVRFCNGSVAANSSIYLGFGATSTPSALGMYGTQIPSAQCYEMTLDHMFTGNIYAIASSATSTLLILSK